jgi:hypothetical protein
MHALHRFITPDTLPHAIVLAAVVLGFAAILYGFVKKQPFYALIVIVVTLFVLLMAGCDWQPSVGAWLW